MSGPELSFEVHVAEEPNFEPSEATLVCSRGAEALSWEDSLMKEYAEMTREVHAGDGSIRSEPAINLNALRDAAHGNSVAKGFYEAPNQNVSEKLMLVVSELAEALEHARAGNQGLPLSHWWHDGVNHEGKPDGFPVELIDAIIRIADLAGWLGIDLDAALKAKLAYNASRPHKHGKKF